MRPSFEDLIISYWSVDKIKKKFLIVAPASLPAAPKALLKCNITCKYKYYIYDDFKILSTDW